MTDLLTLLFQEFTQPHLLLCRPDKAPARPWLNYYPTADECRDWLRTPEHLLGIVPASVGYTVVDVDTGNPLLLDLVAMPAASVPTRSPGRAHLYYLDNESRPNRKWAWRGLSGEIRSGKGYVVIYPGSLAGILSPDPLCDVWDKVEPLLGASSGKLPPPPIPQTRPMF